MRVLLVRSDAHDARVLTDALEQGGHEVIAADHPKQALALFLEHTPDALLVDRGDDALSGVDLCKALRRFDVGEHAFVVLLLESEDEAAAAFEAGADDCLVAPVDHDEMLRRLQRARRKTALRDEAEHARAAQREEIAKLAIQNRKLRAVALLDDVTNLPNQRFAESLLEKEWAAAEDAGQALSVLLIELELGSALPEARNEILREVARAIAPKVVEPSTLTRYRGEALLAVLPATDAAEVARLADGIREATRETFARSGGAGALAVRMGAATRQPGMTSASGLFGAVDAAVRNTPL